MLQCADAHWCSLMVIGKFAKIVAAVINPKFISIWKQRRPWWRRQRRQRCNFTMRLVCIERIAMLAKAIKWRERERERMASKSTNDHWNINAVCPIDCALATSLTDYVCVCVCDNCRKNDKASCSSRFVASIANGTHVFMISDCRWMDGWIDG